MSLSSHKNVELTDKSAFTVQPLTSSRHSVTTLLQHYTSKHFGQHIKRLQCQRTYNTFVVDTFSFPEIMWMLASGHDLPVSGGVIEQLLRCSLQDRGVQAESRAVKFIQTHTACRHVRLYTHSQTTLLPLTALQAGFTKCTLTIVLLFPLMEGRAVRTIVKVRLPQTEQTAIYYTAVLFSDLSYAVEEVNINLYCKSYIFWQQIYVILNYCPSEEVMSECLGTIWLF